MATSDYWSSADLKAVPVNGLIREDVMQKIWDISAIPLPFTDMIGSGDVKNAYTEWTQDRLSDPNLGNFHVDGEDAGGNDAKGGKRVGNHCQISTKQVQVTTRAQNSDTIGRGDELAYQVMMRQRELRRDVEAIALGNQSSGADNGASVAGKAGSARAWLVTNTSVGATGGNGGFANGIVSKATLGTPRGLSETAVRDICEKIWTKGGNPTVFMSRPAVVRKFSEYMFTPEARIGNQQTETGRSGASTAVGSVNVFITDFGVSLKLIANRLQQTADAPATALNDTAYIFDPEYWELGFLHGYRTEPLAKTGLADKRQMAVDWTLRCLNEEASGCIGDISATTAVTPTFADGDEGDPLKIIPDTSAEKAAEKEKEKPAHRRAA